MNALTLFAILLIATVTSLDAFRLPYYARDDPYLQQILAPRKGAKGPDQYQIYMAREYLDEMELYDQDPHDTVEEFLEPHFLWESRFYFLFFLDHSAPNVLFRWSITEERQTLVLVFPHFKVLIYHLEDSKHFLRRSKCDKQNNLKRSNNYKDTHVKDMKKSQFKISYFIVTLAYMYKLL